MLFKYSKRVLRMIIIGLASGIGDVVRMLHPKSFIEGADMVEYPVR